MVTARKNQPWHALYGARSAHVNSDFYNMLSLFRAAVEKDPTANAILNFDQPLTYKWLDNRSDELAAWLIKEGKMARGSRVAVILQNVPEFIITALASWKIGATPMPLNPMYQERELARLFADGLPGVIICHDKHAHTVAAALKTSGIPAAPILSCSSVEMKGRVKLSSAPNVASADGMHEFTVAVNSKRGARPPPASPDRAETGLLLYTSGTTGTPKGAVLSHGALTFSSRVSLDWFGVRQSARILAIAPLFHITGFQCQMCAAFLSQGALVLNYRFDADAVLESMLAHRPTFMIGAITAYIALMNHPSASADHFSSFDTLYAGGGPVPLPVVQKFQSRFGRRIANAYGMTETGGPTHVVPYERDAPVDEASGTLSVGIPVSGADAMVERSDGTPAAAGEAGELLIRGPMVMDGYFNKTEATVEALKDGWMHTGDVAVMDTNGWFFLIDRKKDVIIASGFKVWPREIEDVIYGHPSVREVAVIGVPDSYRGETIRAYVSLRSGMQVTAEELVTLCRTQLASYKAPRQIRFLPELPKTASGKIMRAELRKAAAVDPTSDA